MDISDIQYGISSFNEMIQTKSLYVDKTERIYDLIKTKGSRFFLSRPRRFGKTLLVDILEEIFKGNKELFKGLAIYDKEYDWKNYPVIRINLSDFRGTTSNDLESFLITIMDAIVLEQRLSINEILGDNPRSAENILSRLILHYSLKGQKVVVLIDEYDYPVIKNIDNPEVANKLREGLRDFYSVLKANSKRIHFELLTGVTKLAYTTIFSGVNDVDDISSWENFSDLLGYRQDELEKYFSFEIEKVCKQKGINKKEFLDEIRVWYDGYRFSNKDLKVYNPSSINKFFRTKCEFNVHWISTGTPEFIVKILARNSNFDIDKEFSKEISNFFTNNKLDVLHFERTNLIYLLYQAGYVTVVGIDSYGDYKLGYPNKEVAISFTRYLAQAYLGFDSDSVFDEYSKVVDLHDLVYGKNK